MQHHPFDILSLRRNWLLTLLLLSAGPLASGPASAQAQAQRQSAAPPASFDLSVGNIMRGPELVGRPPENVRWTPDGRWIYFSWVEPGTEWRETLRPYRVRAAPGARPERVTLAHRDSVAPLLLEGAVSQDRRWRAVEHEGDLYLVDLRRSTHRRLTNTLATERAPHFDAGGRRIFFLRENNAFSLDLDGGLVRQLTDIRTGTPARERQAEGQRAILEAQQRELFESVRDRIRADSTARAERQARDSLRMDSLFLGRNERVVSIDASPAGRALLLTTTLAVDTAARRTDVPQFVTESGYVEPLQVRAKVGDIQDSARVAFVALPSGRTHWLRLIPDDSLRAPTLGRVAGWNEAGTQALIFAVSADYKTRYLHTVDAESGQLRTADVLRDTAWVAGPCFACAGWYDGGRRIWWVSEADGWAHLYTAAPDGSDRRQLTRGEWEVTDVELSPDRRFFYLHTSEESHFERHLYRMPVTGGERVKVTRRTGRHEATLSPDAEWLANVHSFANRPPELYLMRNAPGAEMAQVTTSPTAEWRSFPWIVPEIIRIPASDGVGVPARIYRPQEVGAQPNGAAVIFVHGAGYLQNVHNWWSTYYREYMFHHLLASRGYVVLDLDFRASAGYGRDWRTAIYRHMGGRDLQDHVDASRYLQREFGIDPERVGIYGGSYGGFITLMALFTEPQHFGAGAALRAVTDWAHYNHPYTSRILNLPQVDTLSYRQSSPIYFAEGLQDPLLITHGMVDVNVHFSDVVRLAQRLIELQKTDWELAVYPVEDHAFIRPDSWADQYRRIYELFERHLHPERAAPAGRVAEGGDGGG
ncbi:prolyl oligopeptidase family serine peptidase [soil metagenome]